MNIQLHIVFVCISGAADLRKRRRVMQSIKAKTTRRCNFDRCPITSHNKPAHVQLHRLPRDRARQILWIQNMGLSPEKIVNANNLRCCSLHIPDKSQPKKTWVPIADMIICNDNVLDVMMAYESDCFLRLRFTERMETGGIGKANQT